MQKVLLINPPQNTKYPQPPMGLALLGAILERAGYKVSIVDANVDYTQIYDLANGKVSADVVGITAMTPTISSALRIAEWVRFSRAKIIIGGAHASLMADDLISHPTVDVVVKGDGSNAILEVLWKDIKGVYESDTVVNMDALPYLAYHLLPWQKYKPHPPHGRVLPWLALVTSWGCPYHCSFCSRAVFGNKYRAQSPTRVVDEIQFHQKKFGVREIAFYDDVFTLDNKRVFGITAEMLKRNIKLCWTCETRANLVNVELLKQMKRAGCFSIAYGIESGSQEVLDSIDKNIRLEQSEEAIRMTREAGIKTVGYFIIGLPNETPETIRQTINFAKKLKLDYAQFSIATPYPGTKLYEQYKMDKGAVPWDNFVYAGTSGRVSPVFESKELSRGDIERWVSKAYKEFYLRPSYIYQRLNGVKSAGDVRILVNGLKMLKGM